jgi:hypothetical protein
MEFPGIKADIEAALAEGIVDSKIGAMGNIVEQELNGDENEILMLVEYLLESADMSDLARPITEELAARGYVPE